MSHSQRLRLSDVRDVFRLVGEIRERGESRWSGGCTCWWN